jgi:mRNA-degrading endonuclease RelE of RelBE toxin-antitoxin system
MPYQLTFSPRAEQDLERLRGRYAEGFPELLGVLEQGLAVLASNPVAVSRPAVFPYLPNSQMYQIDHTIPGGSRHVFTVLFRYLADEETIFILDIGHYELAAPSPEDDPEW